MTALQLEALAMQTAARVEAGHRIEDSFIEAKREWPTDYPRIARRLAAHANEMRGQPIVWVIGVDEDGASVPGAAKEEQGDWYAQVSKHFDQGVPALTLSRVAYHGDTPVMALLFDTSACPYVVRKEHDTRGFEHDVPMREGTRTRSAKRSEIVGLLAPLAPRIDGHLLGAMVELSLQDVSGWELHGRPPMWVVDWTVYFIMIGSGEIIFPAHLFWAQLKGDGMEPVLLNPGFKGNATNRNVLVSEHDLIVSGSGRATARAVAEFPSGLGAAPKRLHATLELRALNADSVLTFETELVEPSGGLADLTSALTDRRVWHP
ncbi:MAG TPA: hypothetical protein VGB53_05760 [Rubricoccaceae bacterium]|jgi:hypothetical protein